MWKRLNRAREPTSSSPIGGFEATSPYEYLDTIPEARSPTGSTQSPNLPSLPFRVVPPLEETHPRFAQPDRASSVYSEPADDIEIYDSRALQAPSSVYQPRAPSSAYSDVSPPVSPLPAGFPTPSPHDVSPLEVAPPALPVTQKESDRIFKSNLPVPRKVAPPIDPPRPKVASPTEGPIKKFGNSPGWRLAGNSEGTVRWDEYSGEPTTSEKGHQGSVRPVKPGAAQPFAMAREKNKGLFSGFRDRDPAKRRTFERDQQSRDGPSDLPPEREPWKGGSGRTALVTPPPDDPSKRLAPLHIPQDTAKSTVRRVAPDTSNEDIRPTVPLKAGNNSPRVRSPMMNSPISPIYTSSPLNVASALTSISNNANRNDPPASGPIPSDQDNAEPYPDNLDHLRSLNLENQPASRFSATTVATTIRSSPNSSPRVSLDAPPVPQMPSPIVMRKRPLPSSSVPPPWEAKSSPPVRKPAPSPPRKPDPPPRASSIYSTVSNKSKSLPQCPPESQALDRIGGFQARMDDLGRRRRNINKILRELTHVINPSSPGYDLATKAEVKQTVSSLENELADIGQEEHNVGLKLHRAQKKRDAENMYGQPTGLWIKRVTS